MLIVSRRFLVLLTLLFWQGGFMFYSVVVVEVGGKVFGHQTQGWITRSVTNYLNLAGAVALVVWGWDIFAVPDATKRRRWRWALWAMQSVLLGSLALLHLQLHLFLDIESFRILDYSRFRFWHRCYLMTSTAQWLGCMVFMAATLLAWRAEDRRELTTDITNRTDK